MAEGRTRPAWAEVDPSAVRHNAALLREVVGPAALWAVVKADGYGHGATAVARAALEGGAAGLAVALVDEGVELREAGIAAPILLLSEPPDDAAAEVVAARLTPTVARGETLGPLAAASSARGRRLGVHVKVDTGMHRVGVAPGALGALVDAVAAEPALEFEGLWTHLAVAEGAGDEDRAFTAVQLDCFDEVCGELSGRTAYVRHAANSAAAIAWPRARYDLVRVGIALYGDLPSPSVAAALRAATGGRTVRPVMALRARVTAVRELAAGARPSYGRRRALGDRSVVATVPIGYADGVPRALFDAGFEVLIGGRRCPLAGMVTMDQVVVDCGPGSSVGIGDEVTLLGRQGTEEITVGEWAERLGTIGYEVLCGIGPRVPRVIVGEETTEATDAATGEARS